MPLILGTNSIKAAGGYNVDNSLRFESSSTDHLSRSKSSSETSTTIGTFSFWVKRCETGATTPIYSNEVEDGNNRGYFTYINTDNFYVNNSVSGQSDRVLSTTQKFRDLSAWSHFVVAFDTTQSTASNRVKIYHNGNQITAFDTAVYPNQNENLKILEGGQTNKELVGKIYGADNSRMYLAEFHHIDGQALTPTDFGEFDEDSGIWKPIEYDGTYGNNGFYLDFENSGSLGADVSGNGNNFTVNNLTAIDQSTDTCTNNFATFNPLDKLTTGAPTGSEGNLKLTGDASTNNTWNSTIGLSAGKWYVEMKVLQSTPDTSIVFRSQTNTSGSHNNSYGFDTNPDKKMINGSASGSAIGSTSQNDILGMALDLDNGKMFIHRNGTYLSSGNPSTGANPFIVTADGMPTEGVIGGHVYNGAVEWNFGSPSFAISSGNTDGNGYGNFEYAVPSGYLSLCTANLSEVLG